MSSPAPEFDFGTDGPSLILVGVDGSRTSLRAAAYAGGLARRQRCRLLAVYVGRVPAWRKISTLRDLAERFSDGRLDPDALSTLPDEELMAQLTVIPGIGPWTVQGALLIALQREDVVLPGDLALRKAVRAAYGLDHLPSQQEVLSIAEKWRPHRSLATSYLFSAAFESACPPPVAPSET